MVKGALIPTQTRPKILLIAVHAPYNKTKNIESYFEEFLHLVKSNGIIYDQKPLPEKGRLGYVLVKELKFQKK